MSESELYKEGSTIRTSNVNKQNAELASKYKSEQQSNDMQNVIRQTLEAKAMKDSGNTENQWRKDFEGYSQIVNEEDNILQKQTDARAVAQGANLSDSPRAEAARNWQPEPSLLDMVSDKLSSAFNWSPSPTGAANFDDPNKALRLSEEAEYNRQASEQAGLAELKQTLNNREY
jgi:hypothetical protein